MTWLPASRRLGVRKTTRIRAAGMRDLSFAATRERETAFVVWESCGQYASLVLCERASWHGRLEPFFHGANRDSCGGGSVVRTCPESTSSLIFTFCEAALDLYYTFNQHTRGAGGSSSAESRTFPFRVLSGRHGESLLPTSETVMISPHKLNPMPGTLCGVCCLQETKVLLSTFHRVLGRPSSLRITSQSQFFPSSRESI